MYVEPGNQYYPAFWVCYCGGGKHTVGYGTPEYTPAAEDAAALSKSISRANATALRRAEKIGK